MILADSLEYEIKDVYNQGESSACTAFTFFTVLKEMIEQNYDEKVEFDFFKHFDRMEEWRKNNLTPKGKKYKRGTALMVMAEKEGFETMEGKLVKIKGSLTTTAAGDHDLVCKLMQNFGPLMFSIKRYKEHKLNPKGKDVIGDVPAGATKKKTTHMMTLRAFNKPEKQYRFHNSWGSGSIKWIPFDVFEKITLRVYAIQHVYFA